jgi:hypothetical protein
MLETMTAEELAKKHPRLFHLADPECLDGIQRYGLQSTVTLLTRFGVTGQERLRLELDRRPSSVRLVDPSNGVAVLNDNKPLSKVALSKCLDDGLTPENWIALLNKRVFFWPNSRELRTLVGARENAGKKKLLVSLDTLSVAKEYGRSIEISAINTGATLRKAARRGLLTFSPLLDHSLEDWRRLRGKRDNIKEITILDQVERLDRFDVRYEIQG